MRRHRSLLFIVGLILTVVSPIPVAAQEGEPGQVTILFTGDRRGQLRPAPDGRGGLARLVGAVQAERRRVKDAGPLFLFSSGDIFSPAGVSRRNRGELIFRTYERLRYDGIVPGNRDTDLGIAFLKELPVSHPGLPLVSANLFGRDGRPVFSEARLLERGGATIGVFGLQPTDLLAGLSPEITRQYTLKTPVDVAKVQVEQLKLAGADIIVALVHLDDEDAERVADGVKDLDIVIRTGRDGGPLASRQSWSFEGWSGPHPTLVLAPTRYVPSIGRLVVKLGPPGEEGRRRPLEYVLDFLPLDETVPEDPATFTAVETLLSEDAASGQQVLIRDFAASFPGGLLTPGSLVRFMAGILREGSGVEVAILNDGLLRQPAVERLAERGHLLSIDLDDLFFARARFVVMELDGISLKQTLMAPIVWEPLSYAGLEVDPEGRPLVNGLPIRDGERYLVLTTSFLLQSGPYPGLRKGKEVQGLFRVEGEAFLPDPEGQPLTVAEILAQFAQQTVPRLVEEEGEPLPTLLEQAHQLAYENLATWLFEVDDIALMASSVQAKSSSKFSRLPDGRTRARDQFTIRTSGGLTLSRRQAFATWANRLRWNFAQVDLRDGDKNTTRDWLLLRTEGLFHGWEFELPLLGSYLAPYAYTEFVTEFEVEKDTDRRRELFFGVGVDAHRGDFQRFRFGGFGEYDFTDDDEVKLDAGLEVDILYSHVLFEDVSLEAYLRGRFFFPDGDDTEADYLFTVDTGVLFKIPFLFDLQLIVDLDAFIFQGKESGKVGNYVSMAIGLTYEARWKMGYLPYGH